MIKSAISRIIGFFASCALWLGLARVALAQSTGLSGSTISSAPKGGTSSSLPDAGSTELIYLLFVVGAVLFVFGAVRLVLSFRDSS